MSPVRTNGAVGINTRYDMNDTPPVTSNKQYETKRQSFDRVEMIFGAIFKLSSMTRFFRVIVVNGVKYCV
jgi:hypothetical protein